MNIRAAIHAACITLLALALYATAASAQRQAPPPPSRVYISGWGGYFTSFGGFAHVDEDADLDAFFRFDAAPAAGGGLHFYLGEGFTVGVDGVYATADYERLARGTPTIEQEGDAKMAAGLLSARLGAGGGARLGFYLSGGLGVFAYDLDENSGLPDGWDTDFAFYAGAGVDYRLIRHFGLFVEYGQYWAYHQRAGNTRNTAKHGLLRGGARFSL